MTILDTLDTLDVSAAQDAPAAQKPDVADAAPGGRSDAPSEATGRVRLVARWSAEARPTATWHA